MQAFQGVLAHCPWLPVIGNHESTMGEGKDKVDVSTEERYLNQSWGVIFGQDGTESATSTAPFSADIPYFLTTFPFMYGLVSLHMCVSPYIYRTIMKMLLKLTELCEKWGAGTARTTATTSLGHLITRR